MIGPQRAGARRSVVIDASWPRACVALLAFSIGPMVGTLWVSLQEWNLIRPAEFIGLDNYRELWHDDDFRRALRNTLYYLVGYLPLVFVGGLGLALLVNRELRGVNLFRGHLLPAGRHELGRRGAAVAVAAQPQRRRRQLAARPRSASTGPGWWTDRDWAMPSVILASAWKDLGFVMVILLAGLQAIDRDALRGGHDRRRRRVAAAALGHAAAAVAVAVLRRRDQPDQRLPGLRPGVGDDRRRAGRGVDGRRRADRQEHLPVRPRRLRRGAERRAVRRSSSPSRPSQLRLQKRWVIYALIDGDRWPRTAASAADAASLVAVLCRHARRAVRVDGDGVAEDRRRHPPHPAELLPDPIDRRQLPRASSTRSRSGASPPTASASRSRRRCCSSSPARRPPTRSPACSSAAAASLFALYLATMMIPLQVLIVPLFIEMRNLGLVDTYSALLLPTIVVELRRVPAAPGVPRAAAASSTRRRSSTAPGTSGCSSASCCRSSARPSRRSPSSPSWPAGTLPVAARHHPGTERHDAAGRPVPAQRPVHAPTGTWSWPAR